MVVGEEGGGRDRTRSRISSSCASVFFSSSVGVGDMVVGMENWE